MSYRVFSDCHGNPVDLSEECWFTHVLVEHPEMVDEEEKVRLALRDPDFRARNPIYPNRELFFRRCNLRFAPNDFLKVVVAYEPVLDFMRGTLITAYPASSIRQGEELLWTRIPILPRNS